jgi:5-oxoprolinase (ATP-hydrolysing)
LPKGGTFTDVYAQLPDGTSQVLKLLSVDPENYEDGPREGIRRVIASFKKTEGTSKDLVPDDEIEYVKMGTTVATNALLERNGARFVFVTTKGHRDVLEIGDQVRRRQAIRDGEGGRAGAYLLLLFFSFFFLCPP